MSNIRVQWCESEKGRIVVGRLLPGTDLIPGLLEICSQSCIKSGGIISLLGSLRCARFVRAVTDDQSPIGIKYSEPFQVQGPLELLGSQGIVGLSEEGKLMIHLHGLVCDEDNRVYGGHFTDRGNTVLATVEAVIRDLEGVRLLRVHDKETGFCLFKPF